MKILKVNTLVLVLGLLASGAFAQTRTDAVKLFNSGLEQAQAGEYEAAINAFTQAITISEQIGAEAEDIKAKSENQIPLMYFQQAKDIYNTFQTERGLENLDAAIEAFHTASSVADEYSDERVGPLAKRVLPQLYYTKSILLYNEQDLDGATEAVDNALEENSNYALAYYQKAKIFKQKNDTNDDGVIDQNLDELLGWYDQAITVAETTNNTDVASRSRESAHDELVAVGVNHSVNDEVDEAIDLLTRALTYKQESASAHYRLAEAYNKADNFDDAVSHARQALEYENGGRTDKAKIYFELGVAYQMMGNKSEACDAMTDALYGQFKSNAEYKMEHELKCGSTAN